MPYTQVICMECAAEYMQKMDPWGNYYPINVYMCGHCGTRDIYKKELTDEEADEIIERTVKDGSNVPD